MFEEGAGWSGGGQWSRRILGGQYFVLIFFKSSEMLFGIEGHITRKTRFSLKMQALPPCENLVCASLANWKKAKPTCNLVRNCGILFTYFNINIQIKTLLFLNTQYTNVKRLKNAETNFLKVLGIGGIIWLYIILNF